jgi:thiol:disulfide interchange protein DsbC
MTAIPPPPRNDSETGLPAALGALVLLAVIGVAAVVATRTLPPATDFGGPTSTQPGTLLPQGAAPAGGPEAIVARMAERLPGFPAIDEVSATPVAGLYEIRVGNDVLYTDAQADHVIQGQIIDTRTRQNLTEQRLERLTAIAFAELPLADAVVVRQGAGTRRLAVFADPNCGFCKRFERDLAKIDDVTVYTFLYPILGPDSSTKSRDIWCAKDPMKTWRDWMLDGVVPARVEGGCDTAAIERTLALGQQLRLNGTPILVFEDGTRRVGALPGAQVEQLLAAAAGKS